MGKERFCRFGVRRFDSSREPVHQLTGDHRLTAYPRQLIVSEFMSLDGVMQAPGGKDEDLDGGFQYGGWTMPY